MGASINQLKILKAIVSCVAIEMMDVLVAFESAAHMLFHDPAVFGDDSSIPNQLFIRRAPSIRVLGKADSKRPEFHALRLTNARAVLECV